MTRDERIAQTADTAIAACPSIAVAIKVVKRWKGDPTDPQFRADVITELEKRPA